MTVSIPESPVPESSVPAERWHEFITSNGENWRVDVGFLGSGWECIWGRGCRGIGPEADPTHNMGCCSLGAEFADEDDARNVSAHAAFLDPEHFQFAEVAALEGIFASGDRRGTRVVDGACIFLNRPEFPGGAGCALHQAAMADGEPERDWKPIVCWQLPFRIDVESGGNGENSQDSQQSVTPVNIVRRWSSTDFDDDDLSPPLEWLCTVDEAAFGADTSALARHRDDLVELLGDEAVVNVEAEIERRLQR